MLKVISFLNSSLWSWFFLPCILLCGITLTFRLRFVQFRKLPDALRLPFSKYSSDESGISSSQAASTALASTIGTGNIIGTVQAITMGGPGAVFWMWVAAALSMVIKYSEIYLSLFFKGGSPMRYMEKALSKNASVFYAICALGASLCMGCIVQANGCISALMTAADILCQPGARQARNIKIALGVILSFALLLILSGGMKSVGRASEKLVPIMSIGFIILCLAVLGHKSDRILPAFSSIISEAFSPRAEVGGALGSCIQWGLRRGAFSNEAGLGSAGLAHGGVNNKPSNEALWGIFEVFVDTVLICSAVALVIICSEVTIPYGTAPGAELMVNAIKATFKGKGAIIFFSVALAIFAFTSILGWSAYTQICAKYLLGDNVITFCVCITTAAAFLGTLIPINTAWLLADFFNVLMSIPNFIALFILSREIHCRDT